MPSRPEIRSAYQAANGASVQVGETVVKVAGFGRSWVVAVSGPRCDLLKNIGDRDKAARLAAKWVSEALADGSEGWTIQLRDIPEASP